MNLNDAEIKVVWAALLAMSEDNHSAQDTLTRQEWDIVERLLSEITYMQDYPSLEPSPGLPTDPPRSGAATRKDAAATAPTPRMGR